MSPVSHEKLSLYRCTLLCRGAGELLGKRQHGKKALGCLRAAALPGDAQLLEHARAAARKTLIKYGMNPEDWPQPLLAALRDRCPSAPNF